MSGNVRFVKNVVVKLEYNGNIDDISIGAGDIYNALVILIDDEDFCDIVLEDKSVIMGVAKAIFENGGVDVEEVDGVLEEDVEEIDIKAEEVSPVVLDATIIKDE